MNAEGVPAQEATSPATSLSPTMAARCSSRSDQCRTTARNGDCSTRNNNAAKNSARRMLDRDQPCGGHDGRRARSQKGEAWRGGSKRAMMRTLDSDMSFAPVCSGGGGFCLTQKGRRTSPPLKGERACGDARPGDGRQGRSARRSRPRRSRRLARPGRAGSAGVRALDQPDGARPRRRWRRWPRRIR
jgi:hypothetical protein